MKHFIDYLFLLRNLFGNNNNSKKIISNFLEYSEKLIDIASKNILIYDLYHFNKEAIIYGYLYKKQIRFLSKEFRIKYNKMLFKCKKKKYLSLELLKYINEKYTEKGLSNKSERSIMNIKYFQKENIDIKKQIFSNASRICLKYYSIKKAFSELEQKLETIELQVKITKLESELNLDKYINSFLQTPGEFSLFRKSASLILDRIIRKNHEKLKFIEPNEKIINFTLKLISNIRAQLRVFNKKNKVATSIKTKLDKLKTTLISYKNQKVNEKKDKVVIEKLNYPLIIFENKEKIFLEKNITKEEEYKFLNQINVSDEENKDLDFIINYFFELKDKTSKTIHINDKEKIKFFSFSKQLENLPSHDEDDNYEDVIEKIKNVTKMTPNSAKITYDQLITFLFDTEKKIFWFWIIKLIIY